MKALAVKSFWVIITLLPLGAAFYSSTQSAVRAMLANYYFDGSIIDSSVATGDIDEPLIYQRKIQQYYLRYGVYIPIDDIILGNGTGLDSSQLNVLKKSCGAGRMFVWVPLRFRLPVLGEKVMEWCLAVK